MVLVELNLSQDSISLEIGSDSFIKSFLIPFQSFAVRGTVIKYSKLREKELDSKPSVVDDVIIKANKRNHVEAVNITNCLDQNWNLRKNNFDMTMPFYDFKTLTISCSKFDMQ